MSKSHLDYDTLMQAMSANTVDPLDYLASITGKNAGQDFSLSSFSSGAAGRSADLDLSLLHEETNLCNLVRNVINEKNPVPKDVRIDDGGLPQAKNFYEWTTKDEFAGSTMKPFIEQLIIGVILFAEYCPDCSDVEWLLFDHPVDATFAEFEKKVCLLEQGQCPSCGQGRSSLVMQHKLNFYRELAVRAGQRSGKCVAPNTIIITEDGIKEISEYSARRPYGFSDLDLDIHTGDTSMGMSRASKFYSEKPERLVTIELENGMELKGTANHPVLTVSHFVKLKDIKALDELPIHYGQDTWGKHVPSLSTMSFEAEKKFQKFYINLSPSLQEAQNDLSYPHGKSFTVGTAMLMAYMTLKGFGTTLAMPRGHSRQVFVQELKTLFPDIKITESDKGVSFNGSRQEFFLNELMGDTKVAPSVRTMPKVIREAPREYVIAYIQTLFDIDSLYTKNGLVLANNSKRLIRFVSTCLQNLGIRHVVEDLKVAAAIRVTHNLEAFSNLANWIPKKTVVNTAVVKTGITSHALPSYDFTIPGPHRFFTNGIISHNSACVGGMYAPYITHKILKMQKPNSVYRLPSSNVLHGTFVALTYAQAKETLWEFYYGTLVESPWFQQYHALLRHYEDKYGEKIFKFNDTFVQYRHRSFLGYPAGPDKRVLRGRTRVFACLSGDSLVSTNRGLIPIKNDFVGATVDMGGNNRTVVGHAPTGFKKVFKLKLMNGLEIKATGDHKIRVYTGGRYRWTELLDLKDTSQVVCSLGGEFPERYFIPNWGRLTLDIAEFLGYFVSCGSYENDVIALNFETRELRDAAIILVSRILKTEEVKCNVADNYIEFREAKLVALFIYLGIPRDWEHNKLVPEAINLAPRNHVTLFLSAATRRYVLPTVFSTDSKPLSQGIQLLFIRLGYGCERTGDNFNFITIAETQTKRWSIEYKGPNKPKPCKVPQFDKTKLYTSMVESIEYMGMANVYDIQVDAQDHAFTANGIVVHNSIDELGWFDNSKDNKKVKINAKEVYIALERSLLTVRTAASKLIKSGYDDVLHGHFLNVSSPSSQRDMICELTRNAVDSRTIYGIIRPTWMMNPTITREDLNEEYNKDPVAAERDYGAEPPLSNNPFIQSQAHLDKVMEGNKGNGIVIKHYQNKTRDGFYSRYAKIVKCRRCSQPSLLAIDAGHTNNSFACVVGRLSEDGLTKIDLYVEIMPRPGIPLNYTLIYDHIIVPLFEERNIQVLLADRWNSLKLLSDSEVYHDITAKQYSLKYSDLWNTKTAIEQQEILLPSLPKDLTVEEALLFDQDEYPRCFEYKPVEHFCLQALTVQDTGSSVIKGDGDLTDDIWRAMALAHWGIQDEQFFDELSGFGDEEDDEPARPDGPLAVIRQGRSSSSAGGKVKKSNGLAIGMSRSRR